MKDEMSYGNDYQLIPATSIQSGHGIEVLPDVYQQTIQIVNICLIGHPDSKQFVLVDAGMPYSAREIISTVEERFGKGSRPKAIILTHGHFDHIGAIIELIHHWEVPVYAHSLELPYLTGKKDYPEPDPTVEGGLVAKISALFPNKSTQLGDHVQALPANGEVPHMPEFRWIHTPGHTLGHISLFREMDRTLIVGDAFITVKQESLFKLFTQEKEISGPPRYLTTDWQDAWNSVKRLADLQPSSAITGHGQPMAGEELTENLRKLVQNFDRIAIPEHGKYVNRSISKPH